MNQVFTVTGPMGKCHRCKGLLKPGQEATVEKDGDFVTYSHFECPTAPESDPNERHTQGSK